MLEHQSLSELRSLIAYSTSSERDRLEKLLLKEFRDATPGPELRASIRARCESDIGYFVNAYCWTYDPRDQSDPEMLFKLFPRQEEFLAWLQAREKNQEDGIAEKCRDVGFTWLCCAYALYGWLFRKGFKAGFGSRVLKLVDRKGDPDTIFEKLRFLLYRLPRWMLPAGFSERLHDGLCKILNPQSGASIIGEGGDNIGRGGRTTVYFLDEAAFVARPKKIDAALSQNSRCKIHVSTPNGMGNPFAQKRFSGKFPVFTFRWTDDPRKDEAWYRKQKDTLDPVILAQEVDIDYTASIEGICIPAAWVLCAVNLKIPEGDGPVIAGLDIAAGGKNKSVFLARRGPVVKVVESWGQMNTTQTTWKAAELAEKHGVKTLCYDCIGVGEGVRGTLDSAENKPPFATFPVSSGDTASDSKWPDGKTSRERFKNLRAELWCRARRRFEKTYEYVKLCIMHPVEDLVSLPDHQDLITQLSLPTMHKIETGKVGIESKQDMAKRGVASPDHADAFVFAFADEVMPQPGWAQDKAMLGWLASR